MRSYQNAMHATRNLVATMVCAKPYPRDSSTVGALLVSMESCVNIQLMHAMATLVGTLELANFWKKEDLGNFFTLNC